MKVDKGNSFVDKNTEIEKGNSMIEKNTEIEKGNSMIENNKEIEKRNSVIDNNVEIDVVDSNIDNNVEIDVVDSIIDNNVEIEVVNSIIDNNVEIEVVNSMNENNVEIIELEMESEQSNAIENESLKRKRIYFEQKLNKLYNPVDIKYRGPLSSRYLSLLAWIAIAFGQINIVNSIFVAIFDFSMLSNFFNVIFSFIYVISTPLFIIASYGRTLSGNGSYLDFFISKGLSYFGIGIAVGIFYLRYLRGLLRRVEGDEMLPELMNNIIIERVNINIFADIFVLGLFHFFVNYNPKVYFQGKKIIIFRSLCIIPILYIIISNILIILSGTTKFILPFYIYPFITVRSPSVCLIFICTSLWIKNRERTFLKLGSTKKEYKKFILTNRNSLSYSIFLSSVIVIFCVIEFIVMMIFCGYQKSVNNANDIQIDALTKLYGFGECFSLIISIPFIMLYSYTKTHENKMYDVAIPFIGIGISFFIYIEGIYQILTHFIDEGNKEDNFFDIDEIPTAELLND